MTSTETFDFSGLDFQSYYPDASATTPQVDAATVPQAVRDQVEEQIAWFADPAHDGGALRVTFPDKVMKARWVGMAQAYALSRTGKGNAGPWVLKTSPGQRGSEGEGLLRFRLIRKDKYEAKQDEARRIRAEKKAAEEAAKGKQG